MTAVVPGDFSNSIQNHCLSFSLNYFPFCFDLFYCSTSVLIVFFLCRRWLVQMRNEMNLLLPLSLSYTLSLFYCAIPYPSFCTFTTSGHDVKSVLSLSGDVRGMNGSRNTQSFSNTHTHTHTHTKQSLKERNNFLYYRGDNWHFWEKQQVFSYSLTDWRKLWSEYTVFE